MAQIQGPRPHMEDTYSIHTAPGVVVAGVFDGHGGDGVARFLSENLGRSVIDGMAPAGADAAVLGGVFVDVDRRVAATGMSSGSTACVVVVDRRRRGAPVLTFANCGDSLAIFGTDRGVASASFEHKVSNEAARLRRLGARITNADCARIEGGLNVSRSFGDMRWKRFVTSEPYVARRAGAGVRYVLLATDGIWDVMTPQDVHAIVTSSPRGAAAADVVREASRRRSGDNLTVLVVFMGPPAKRGRKTGP